MKNARLDDSASSAKQNKKNFRIKIKRYSDLTKLQLQQIRKIKVKTANLS